jgi:HK97 family phage portal protein
MSLWRNFTQWILPDEYKQPLSGRMPAAGSIALAGVPGAVYPAANFDNFVRRFFKRNELIQRCVSFKAAAVASAPLRIYRKRDGQELPDHAARQLLLRPNPWESEYDLKERISMHLDLAGNAFIQKVRTGGGRPAWLWSLNPDEVSMMISPTEGLVAYKHAVGSTARILAPDDVIHFKTIDPSSHWMGTPPMLASLRQATSDNEATDYATALLQNRAVPGIVIETESTLGQDDVDRLTALWKQAYGGNKRGAPAFLQKGMKVNAVSLDMQKLEFTELRAVTETRICLAFGIPPVLIGVKAGLDRATFSNYEEARRSFYEDTIEPLWNKIDDRIEHDLLVEYGQDVECTFDSSELAAFRQVRRDDFNQAQTGVVAGWLTVNEAREMAGYPPVMSGDAFLRSIATITEPAKVQATGRKLFHVEHKKVNPLALVQGALGIRKRAELWFDKLKDAATDAFKLQAQDVLEAVKRAFPQGAAAQAKADDPGNFGSAADRVAELQAAWQAKMDELFGGLFSEIIGEAAEQAGFMLGVEFDLSSAAQQKFVKDYVFRLSKITSQTSLDDVKNIILTAQTDGLSYREMVGQLKDKFAEWSKYRAEMVARTETIRASNYGAKEAYRSNGITKLEWLSAGDGCEDCLEKNGKVVGIEGNFANLGDELPSGATVTYEDVGAPPLHPHCRCTIIPVLE